MSFTPDVTKTDHTLSANCDLEKGLNNKETVNTGKLRGREVISVPTSFAETAQQNQGGISCIGVLSLTLIAGGIMYGVCKDPSKEGCNESIKYAGKLMMIISGSLIGAVCGCLSCIAAATGGYFLATKK